MIDGVKTRSTMTLMAEQVTADTAAWGEDGGGESATVIVPADLAAETPLAWSAAPDDPEPQRESWRAAIVVVAAILVLAGSIAFVIATWSQHDARPEASTVLVNPSAPPPWPPASSFVPAPAPTSFKTLPPKVAPTRGFFSTPAAPVPFERTWTAGQEQAFISGLMAADLSYTSRAEILDGAKATCVQFDNGLTYAQVAAGIAKHVPNAPAAARSAYIAVTVRTLCPDHEDLLP